MSALKEPPLSLIVAIPLLIAIGREGRSNHTISRAGCTATIPSIYIVDDAVIKATERKHSLEDARVNIYTFCRLDLVHLHSQAFWQTYLACAGHRPTPYPPPRAGLSTVPTFTSQLTLIGRVWEASERWRSGAAAMISFLLSLFSSLSFFLFLNTFGSG